METIIKDSLFELAERYVEDTAVSLFLTGKAGTGKTTFLRYIVAHTTKRCVVLAPTGVAAINAEGSTIHSFFSLPLCPYLPDVPELRTEYQMPEQYRRLRKDKIKIIRTLDLLIIDEISMVRADLLDAVDMMLRKFRRSDSPFGGVQLLMIGDAQQLSPVVTEAERPFIAKVYRSPYFFHSKALQQVPYLTIELKTIYRQEDATFISLLNGVRDARVSPEMLRQLNARVGAPAGDDWIRLTTHNYQADNINAARMDALPGDAYVFEAEVEGDYPESLYPAAASLALKAGARVMFIRNDTDGRFYNGKLGTVLDITEDVITVVDDENQKTSLERVEWENLQYTLHETTGEIVQEVKGVFRQFPLRPAWAITIHKSQGLTFDHVIIDAGSAFAFGQVYVALSRCRSLEGISLTRPISPSLLLSDEDVSSFHASFPAVERIIDALPEQQSAFGLAQLCACFDFEALRRQTLALRKIWRDSTLASTYPAQLGTLEEISSRLIDIEEVASRFRTQLCKLHGDVSRTRSRVAQACDYFLPLMENLGLDSLLSVEIDHAETKKRIKNLAADLLPQWQSHIDTLQEVKARGFDARIFRQVRTHALLEERKASRKPKKQKVAARDVYGDNRHPELVEALVAWRREKCRELNVPAYYVLHQKTLLCIADARPTTREELLEVPGFGPGLWERYGEEILEVLIPQNVANGEINAPLG